MEVNDDFLFDYSRCDLDLIIDFRDFLSSSSQEDFEEYVTLHFEFFGILNERLNALYADDEYGLGETPF